MSIFEVIMLICFGLAWPFSIYRSYKTKSVQGKSPIFLIVILIGYISGILNKLIYNYDNVIYLYIINTIMVTIDYMLYIRNTRLVKKD